MQTYRNTLSRAVAAVYRAAEATGPVTLPVVLILFALEVLA